MLVAGTYSAFEVLPIVGSLAGAVNVAGNDTVVIKLPIVTTSRNDWPHCYEYSLESKCRFVLLLL